MFGGVCDCIRLKVFSIPVKRGSLWRPVQALCSVSGAVALQGASLIHTLQRKTLKGIVRGLVQSFVIHNKHQILSKTHCTPVILAWCESAVMKTSRGACHV